MRAEGVFKNANQWIARGGLAALVVLAWPAATATPSAKPHGPAAKAAERKPPARNFKGHPAMLRFADEVAARRGWDRDEVVDLLSSAVQLPAVQRLIMPPPAGTAKNWAAYRARFVEPRRIQAGLRFWQQHAAALALAEQRYGVPAEIVVSIVGIETFYGRFMGDFRLLDALSTLSFEFPSGRSDRSAFFREQLEELLVWTRQSGADARQLRGSFAGAWGLPQFMPGSINRHAVDFDGDGRIDLASNGSDVVGSVAHYLAQFGWQKGMPTHYPVAVPVDTAQRARLLQPDILPSFTAAEMQQAGAELGADALAHQGPLALVELQNGDAAPSYVAGTRNFYVVTRYNWSSYYALAVIDLASELARSRAQATAQR
jgi:membrane-bound lytic murein transglycosylase B